jgi:hypothetical protein
MCVDFRRSNRGVTEKPLDEPDINPGLNEKCGCGMPQHVGSYPSGEPDLASISPEFGSNGVRLDRRAETIKEQRFARTLGLPASRDEP